MLGFSLSEERFAPPLVVVIQIYPIISFSNDFFNMGGTTHRGFPPIILHFLHSTIRQAYIFSPYALVWNMDSYFVIGCYERKTCLPVPVLKPFPEASYEPRITTADRQIHFHPARSFLTSILFSPAFSLKCELLHTFLIQHPILNFDGSVYQRNIFCRKSSEIPFQTRFIKGKSLLKHDH